MKSAEPVLHPVLHSVTTLEYADRSRLAVDHLAGLASVLHMAVARAAPVGENELDGFNHALWRGADHLERLIDRWRLVAPMPGSFSHANPTARAGHSRAAQRLIDAVSDRAHALQSAFVYSESLDHAEVAAIAIEVINISNSLHQVLIAWQEADTPPPNIAAQH